MEFLGGGSILDIVSLLFFNSNRVKYQKKSLLDKEKWAASINIYCNHSQVTLRGVRLSSFIKKNSLRYQMCKLTSQSERDIKIS